MPEPRTPDFLVIGGQRCATGWLAQCLREHPRIFMAPDETRYFDLHHDRGLKWWLNEYFQSEEARKATRAGEKTAQNLYEQAAPGRVAAAMPEARLIVILRHPIDRLCSEVAMVRRQDKSVGLDRWRELLTPESWFVKHSRYSLYISRWLQRFPRERLLLLVYEDKAKDPLAFVRQAYDFLDVTTGFEPPSATMQVKPGALENDAGWRFALARVMLSSRLPFRKLYNRLRPPSPPYELPPDAASYLKDLFAEEVDACEALLERKLPAWR